MKGKITQHTLLLLQNMIPVKCKFFSDFFFFKREIDHYFVNFFKVSGRSIEESLSR